MVYPQTSNITTISKKRIKEEERKRKIQSVPNVAKRANEGGQFVKTKK
tara:strand:- start:101 stop:244 length:144 start_codon:yes stop_codon:yes gene_type:complete